MRALILTVLALPTLALANPEVGPGGYFTEWEARNERSANPVPPEFTFINYFFTRATITNMIADPAGLRGVSLGPFGIGEAGSATSLSDTSTAYVEQRWIPVLAYSPHFIDGLATFRAQLEIDYTWGQAANQIQNNQGGGLNADQVNVQTKNVNVALYPTRNPLQLSIIAGTQPFYDSIYDPTVTSLFHITKTGYKLAYMGSDATGLSVYGHFGDHRFKTSFMPLGATQAKKATDNDPDLYYVWMATLDYGYELAPATEFTLSLWHLQDNTRGRAFAFEGLVNSGPSSPSLFPFTGVADFSIEEASGAVTWIGGNFHHNVDFTQGDFALSGFVMANFGKYESQKESTELNEELAIRGLAANLEVAFNHGKTMGDVISLEGMFTTGDDDIKDSEYDGVMTLNHYGLPGSVWFNHKTLLMFPFTSTVSNYTGAVTDISNQGYGLMAAILAAKTDLVPDVLNLKLGAAAARSVAARTPSTVDGITFARGKTIGAEFNVELNWQIRYLMNLGFHAGYMALGDFHDATPTAGENPWAAFTTFTWYGF